MTAAEALSHSWLTSFLDGDKQDSSHKSQRVSKSTSVSLSDSTDRHVVLKDMSKASASATDKFEKSLNSELTKVKINDGDKEE